MISQAQSASQVQNLQFTSVQTRLKSMSALCDHLRLKIHSSFPCYHRLEEIEIILGGGHVLSSSVTIL
jgi:hypothetical protein